MVRPLSLEMPSFRNVGPMNSAKKSPWQTANPKPVKKRRKLKPAQKSKAKERARKARRAYPNLIDNMAVSKPS